MRTVQNPHHLNTLIDIAILAMVSRMPGIHLLVLKKAVAEEVSPFAHVSEDDTSGLARLISAGFDRARDRGLIEVGPHMATYPREAKIREESNAFFDALIFVSRTMP